MEPLYKETPEMKTYPLANQDTNCGPSYVQKYPWNEDTSFNQDT